MKFEVLEGIGRREEMQDAGCIGSSDDNRFLWVIVCDGIGGNTGGKLAATNAVKVLHSFLKKELGGEQQLHKSSFLEEGIRLIRKGFEEEINKES